MDEFFDVIRSKRVYGFICDDKDLENVSILN